MATFVIVGASLAGAKAAETLREEGFDGEIVLIGADPDHPYERPPLSKGYLLGTDDKSSVYVHEEKWYSDNTVDLRTGVTVTRLDRPAKEIELAGGARQPYDKLLIATGATPKTLPVPGGERALTLRTLADCERLKSAFANGGHVAIAGAGWIGLETAAAARQAGCEVTVVEPEPTPLFRPLGPEAGEVFAGLHARHGVDLRLEESLAEVRPESVLTTGGDEVLAGTVIAAVGVVPNTALAEDAGLEVDDGIRVDASLRTVDPDVYAVGDVAHIAGLGRVEHWSNALDGGPAAARSMLGLDVVYDRMPYFFTDQYELGMEFTGDTTGYDDVVFRGSVDELEFIAYWLRGGRVIAGMNVGIWDVVDDIQRLIRSGSPPPD